MPADLSSLLAQLRSLKERATPGKGMPRTARQREALDAFVDAVTKALPRLLRELEALEEARRSGALIRAADWLAGPEGAVLGDFKTTYENHVAIAAALRRLAATDSEEET